MKKLVLTAALVLGLVMGSFAQNDDVYYNAGSGLFYRGHNTRDDEAGLFLPGDGLHGIGGNADGTDTYFDDNEWEWQSHLPVVPLGSGALLLMGFGAAYAMSKRKKKE
jgi:hypothetical protein